jgi:hypothetical protein
VSRRAPGEAERDPARGRQREGRAAGAITWGRLEQDVADVAPMLYEGPRSPCASRLKAVDVLLTSVPSSA